jgi:hypothetical protein
MCMSERNHQSSDLGRRRECRRRAGRGSFLLRAVHRLGSGFAPRRSAAVSGGELP